jgi:hypothetical protein
VNELKGRMMLVSVLRTLQCAVALAVLDVACAVFLGIDLSSFAEPVMRVLLGSLVAQGAVLTAWNAAAGLSGMRDDREERHYQATARQLEQYRQEAESAEAFAARMEPGIRAVQRAMAAGTYSVNGKRYAGPPPQQGAAGYVSVGCAVCGMKITVSVYQPGRAYACAACWKGL